MTTTCGFYGTTGGFDVIFPLLLLNHPQKTSESDVTHINFSTPYFFNYVTF